MDKDVISQEIVKNTLNLSTANEASKYNNVTDGDTENADDIAIFKSLVGQLTETYEKKNHDYGHSFDKSMEEFGTISAVIRMNDKLSRFKSLIKFKAQVKEESIQDTLLDLATYAIMTAAYMKKHG